MGKDEEWQVLNDKAYYNLGVELEYLREYELAKEAFSKSKMG